MHRLKKYYEVPLFFLMAFFFSLSISSYASLPDFTKIAKNTLPAVVNISTTQVVKVPAYPFGGFNNNDPLNRFFHQFFDNMPQNRTEHALGSGCIISPDGYIITNYHVIRRATTIKVKLLNTNEVYTGKVAGKDPQADIALIKIKPNHKLPFLKLGNSDKMRIGQWVLAVGNPFGLNGTVTAGIVSAKGRVIGEGAFDHFIQTDASINPGNSGGPLINLDGNIIGINTAIVAGGQGIGFAIPINMVKTDLPYLMKGKKIERGYLGVSIQPITMDAAKQLGLNSTNGAIIRQVYKGSAADKAGLKAGDIIISINSKMVKSASSLPYIVSSMPPHSKIEIGIIRNKQRMIKEATLSARPAGSSLSQAENGNKNIYKTDYGFSVSDLTAALKKRYNIKSAHGVVIVSVKSNSFAHMAGVRAGDVIVKLNYNSINNLNEFKKEIKKHKNDNVIFINIIRGNTKIFLTIQK